MKNKQLAVLMVLMLLLSVLFMSTPIMPTSAGSAETIEVSRPIQLTTNSHYDRDCCFLIDKYGTYWLFFTRGRGDPTTPGYNPDNDFYDIYYLKSTDQGVTWIEYSMPSHVNNLYCQREVAAYEIPEINTIVVFFTDAFYPGASYGAYYTYTNNNGTSWATPVKVPTVTTAYHIDALNAYGKRWLFFEGPGSLIYVTYLSGSTWSTPIQISESGKHGGIPKAMIDDDGNFNVVWCGWTEGGIYHSKSSNGITWSTPQLILTSTYVACDPVLVQDVSGTYWLFWAPWDSATDSQWLEVIYSTDGTAWSSSIHVTSGGYGGNYWWDMWPEAYVKPDGSMLLFYTSEVKSGSYAKGDGNIWMFEVVWNLANNHYEFIQNAINTADSGDIIIVHEGTYLEALYINKTLTIRGSSKPVIRGSQLFATEYGNREAVIFVENASQVVLENLDIEGEGLGPAPTRSYGVLYQNSSGSIRDCIVSPNTINDMYSLAVAAISRSNLIVESNLIQNFGRVGVYATNVENIYIHKNEIIGQTYSQNNFVNYGVEIEDWDGASTAQIIENKIHNSNNTHPSPSWSSAGIIVDIWRMFYELPPSNVSILNNEIYDNYLAIEVVSNPLLYAHYNSIYNNTYGVYVDPDLDNNYEPFDARYNWWGHETGPFHETSWMYMDSPYGPHYGLGDSVGDYVLYVPWLQIMHDIAVLDVSISPTTVVAGETVTINVTVENQGTDFENFTVTVYYDDTSITSQNVVNLFPGWNTTLTFYWNTTGMPRGNYTIKAVITPVPEETDIEDNVLVDGTVRLLWRDITVVEVVPSRNWVYQGHSVNINVTVLNDGDLPETVLVTLYYNITAGETIGTETVDLQPGESATITFVWNTANVPYCHNYTITAVATIPLDCDPTDNILADRKVKVRIIGDVDGNDVVSMLDLFIISQSFGFTKEMPQWNADVDLNQDNIINLLDLYIAAVHFGLICP